jgi:hypothetical protein
MITSTLGGGTAMVTKDSVEKQLKRISFNYHGWGRTEAHELHNIILPDEDILEAVNGFYEGGFAMCLATDVRVLLVDKKPMNYLTVEDLRFDMINEIDYSHRLLGARITISTGPKTLRFTSFNQQRLRKLIGHVQHRMADVKKKQHDHEVEQKSHLEQINQQLQAYLLAQHQQQQELQKQLNDTQSEGVDPSAINQEPVKPSPELADFLYAQSLLAQSGDKVSQETLDQIKAALPAADGAEAAPVALPPIAQDELPKGPQQTDSPNPNLVELYEEGMKEIFGSRRAAENHAPQINRSSTTNHQAKQHTVTTSSSSGVHLPNLSNPLEINPLRVAYSKLPMALRNRKFGRPSFHAHSQASFSPQQTSSVR